MKLEVRLLDIDEQNVEYNLLKEEQGDRIVWKKKEDEFGGPDFGLEVSMDRDETTILGIEKGHNILDTEHEIRHRFYDVLFEQKMIGMIREEDGFDEADETEAKAEEGVNPYNPKLIRVDTKPFPIFQIRQMIQDGELDLSPDFQRNFVWTDITRKSRLIESLLLRIPLPVFYFAQDENGLFQVVDGVQRLTVINSFMNNAFKLKNLEYLKECDGRWYKNPDVKDEQNLPGVLTRRIEQTQLYINVIDPQTPEKVKYDIFKRINTGGKALNNQEIRNCLASKKTRLLLHTLSGSQQFITATRGSISPTRMADEELILRFIAFYLIDRGKSTVSEYRGGMDELLDETVGILNNADIELFTEVRSGFLNAMEGAWHLFGDNAFRKASFVNKALFLGISRVLCRYSLERIKTLDGKIIERALKYEIENNPVFSGALSMATNDARNVNEVFSTIDRIMKEGFDEQMPAD